MTNSRKNSAFVQSHILPTVIYCWNNIAGKKPDLNLPHWSVDINSNPYGIYCEYMDKFGQSNHGFTYREAEEWLSETLLKLQLPR